MMPSTLVEALDRLALKRGLPPASGILWKYNRVRYWWAHI